MPRGPVKKLSPKEAAFKATHIQQRLHDVLMLVRQAQLDEEDGGIYFPPVGYGQTPLCRAISECRRREWIEGDSKTGIVLSEAGLIMLGRVLTGRVVVRKPVDLSYLHDAKVLKDLRENRARKQRKLKTIEVAVPETVQAPVPAVGCHIQAYIIDRYLNASPMLRRMSV